MNKKCPLAILATSNRPSGQVSSPPAPFVEARQVLRSRCLRAFMIASLVILVFHVDFSQSRSRILVTIVDDSGAVVPGVELTLESRSGRLERTSHTASDGSTAFDGLSPGFYIVAAGAEGFGQTVSKEIEVKRGEDVPVRITLSPRSLHESVVVVATDTPQATGDLSKPVTTVTADEIESRKSVTLSETLRGTPGLRVQQQGAYGALTSLRFRGLRSSDTSVLLDGLRLRDASDVNGSVLPLLADLVPVDVAQLEVLRGSGSSIYGTNAIGGVINIVPVSGEGTQKFEAGFEAGSLGLFRENLKASGGLGSRAGYSLGLTRIDMRRGIDGHDRYGNTAGLSRFQFSPASGVEVVGNVMFALSNATVKQSPFALPAAFTSGQFPDAIEGQTFEPDFNDPDQGRRNNLVSFSVKLNQQISTDFSYTAGYQHVSSRRRNYNGPGVDPAFASLFPFGDFAFVSTNNGTTDTLDARANLALGKHDLLTGGFEWESESIFQEFLPSFSAVNDTTDRQKTFALFFQNQVFALNRKLQIAFAAREQFFRLKAADRPGFLAAINPPSAITGDVAVTYFVRSTGTRFRSHVGNGFRAPSLFERFGEGVFAGTTFTRFGDPTLKGEQSIGADAGVDQRLAGNKLVISATYFYTALQRIISFSGFAVDPLGVGRTSGYVNMQGGLSRGVEVDARATPFSGASVDVNYTYTNSDARNAGSLQREFVIPQHQFGMIYSERYRRFLFNADVSFTGSYLAPVFERDFPFREAILRFNGYTKVDSFVSYERPISEATKLLFYGGAENLLNMRFFESGFRTPGIAGRAGLAVRF